MSLPLRLAATLCALACLLHAGGPAAWESNSWPDFLKGRFSGVSLTRDGRLALAPRLDTLATTGESAVWSVIRASDGALWFATGHRGRLYRLAPGASTAAKPQPLWTAQQPEIFALAPAPAGAVFAATSPGGQVWRIDPSGKAQEWFNTKAKYVWSLAVAPDGALFAATGDDGRVWRITAQGQGVVWYETGQAHVTCLAFDNSGALLAGSEPNGNLYRITAQNRASVVLHSTLPEIRDVLALPDGSLLAAALGGGLAQKQSQAAAASAAAAMASIPTMTTTITVTADPSSHSVPTAPTQAGLDLKPPAPRSAAPVADASASPLATAPVEVAGVEKSALYRIAPDLSVETIWTSKEENLLGLALSAGTPFVSTDLRGRVYSVAPNARTALVVETGEGEATRLLDTPAGLLVATGTLAKLFILNASSERTGWYESSVFDAGAVARWGRLEWRGDLAGARIAFRTRSGNSARPDKTWSDWSEPLTDPASARLSSPNARYVQWKLELQGSAPSAATPSASGSGASIDAVSLSYQPQNNRPVVRSITVTPQWVAAPQKPFAQAQSGAGSAFSVTVTDSGDSGPATTSGTPTQQINRGGVLQLFLSWQADDPDNDRLIFTLQVRGEGEREWKTLKSELTDNTYSLDADSLADGRYRFRVTASDRPSNPPSQAREADLESAPVLLDQTPPQVTLAEPSRGPQGILNIEVEAVDALSPVRRAEVSIDAGPWRPMECADGVADSLRERFLVSLPALTAGEHLVTVRVYDASGNAGLARRVIH